MQAVEEKSCLIIGSEDPEDLDIQDESEVEKLRRVQKKLNHALKILGVKISSFNALYTQSGRILINRKKICVGSNYYQILTYPMGKRLG